MVLKAALKNERHPEYGVVTLPFPIPKEEYDSTIQMLKGLDIGDAVRQDCTVEELQSGRSILQRLEGAQVNVDELDYLAKRLDSFVDSELAQFQGMACKLDLTDMKDLISLTFSCQRATVIADFSDLEAIGRSHYLNTHGGCASMEELEQLDGTETAILLMTDNEGIVTPYGVVYDNGMHLHHFESPEDEDKPFDMQKTTRMRARRSHKSFLVTLKKYTWHYVFILPGALALFFFAYVPMSGLVVAFEDYIIYKGPWESPWNNFENFSFLQDPFFWFTVKNTLLLTGWRLLVTFPAPIILALLINEVQRPRVKKVIQSLSYLPHFVSWVVVAYLANSLLALDTGVVNNVLQGLGFEQVYFMGTKNLFRPMIILVGLWKDVGWNAIIYIAALAGVNPELHEAAIMDGSNRVRRIWHINIPAIMPTISILLILSMPSLISAGYESILPFVNPSNLDVSSVLDVYVVRLGLEQSRYDVATAIGLVLSIVSLGILLISNFIAGKLNRDTLL